MGEMIMIFIFQLLRSVGPELSVVSRSGRPGAMRAVASREVVVVIPVTSRPTLNPHMRSRLVSIPSLHSQASINRS